MFYFVLTVSALYITGKYHYIHYFQMFYLKYDLTLKFVKKMDSVILTRFVHHPEGLPEEAPTPSVTPPSPYQVIPGSVATPNCFIGFFMRLFYMLQNGSKRMVSKTPFKARSFICAATAICIGIVLIIFLVVSQNYHSEQKEVQKVDKLLEGIKNENDKFMDFIKNLFIKHGNTYSH